jgi:hypothetical protein
MLIFRASALFALAGCTAVSIAQIHYDSNGFEPPTFQPGSIQGQDGWLAGWSSGNLGTIEPGAGPSGGSQIARSHLNVSGFGSFTRNVQGWLVFNDGFSFSADMRLNSSFITAPPSGHIAYAGVGAQPFASGATPTLALLAFRAGAGVSFGVDVSNKQGYLLVDDVGPSLLFETPLDTAWHNLRIHYHVPTNSYTGYVDGVPILSRAVSGYEILSFGAVILASRRTAATEYSFVDFDNAVAAVPEPGTVAALGFGLLLLRRKQSKR